MPPGGGRKPRRRRKPVPADIAEEVCDWIAGGDYLRDYCRQPGRPAPRTIYAWTAKDPEFRRRFQLARECGETLIRERLYEFTMSPMVLTALSEGSRAVRRWFHRQFIRPVDLRLQRWRRHPRRADRARVGGR
jgi:hypothetical protein